MKSVDSIRLKMAGTMARKGGNARMWECVEERARGMDTVPEPSACRLCALGSLPEALVGVVEVSCLGIGCMGCGVEWKGMLRDSRSEGDSGKDVRGAPSEGFKVGYFLRMEEGRISLKM